MSASPPRAAAFARALEDVMHQLFPGSALLDTSKRYL